MKQENRTMLWVFITGFLLIMALFAYGIVATIWQSADQAQQAIQPVSELTSNVATQVARILNPTPTVIPDPVTIIHRVASLARLETIQYSVEKVITAESGQGPFGFLFGDRLLLVAHGTVIAGVDFARLQPGDFEVRDQALYVRLPDAEVFISALDSQKSYVYHRDTGLLTKGNINLETNARQAAEEEIRKAALADGILEQARMNAENYLYRFLRELGFADVIFIHPTPQD